MACHVFALSGDPATIDNVHARYQALGNYLIGTTPLPPAVAVAAPLAGLNLVTRADVENALAELGDNQRAAILGLLCTEFGLAQHIGSGIRLWGHFEEGQMLPEHMYVTYTNGNIYDTMPDTPVRRNANNNGINPPSYGPGNNLAPDVVFSVEVAALAAGTMTVINAANPNWANGMG